MSLADLNKLESEAKFMDAQNDKLKHSVDILKALRINQAVFPEGFDKMKANDRYGSEHAFRALYDSINDVFLDCVRLAELRLAAEMRENKLKAAQRRAVLNACIVEIPKVGEA